MDEDLYNVQQLRNGLVSLNVVQIDIIKMAYYEGLTQTEIAMKLRYLFRNP